MPTGTGSAAGCSSGSMTLEAVAAELLRAYGFVHTEVMGRSGDGGIDGHGHVRTGFATLRRAFRCERWRENVGGPQVDAFRGAIQDRYELVAAYGSLVAVLRRRSA